MNFLNKPNEMKMYMTMNQAGIFCCFKEYNLQIKSKYTFFQKKYPDVITMDNTREMIFMGDMAGKPMEELAVLLNGICIPVLSNPTNHRGWPKVVADDVVQHLRTFKNIVDQVRNNENFSEYSDASDIFRSKLLSVFVFKFIDCMLI